MVRVGKRTLRKAAAGGWMRWLMHLGHFDIFADCSAVLEDFAGSLKILRQTDALHRGSMMKGNI